MPKVYPPPSSIRFPPDLKAEIGKRAKAANRTFSQEVVFSLRQHYGNTTEPPPSDAYKRAEARSKAKKS